MERPLAKEPVMRIDCAQCEMYETEHCDDCLVTALLHPPDHEIELDEELDESLRALSGAGLIPVLKFRPRATHPGDGTRTEADSATA